MKGNPRVASANYVVLLVAIFMASACEPVALRPQPDVDRRGIERPPDGRGTAKDEIIGTVERVDRTEMKFSCGQRKPK